MIRHACWSFVVLGSLISGTIPAEAQDKPKKLPDPENVTVTAKDGVQIHCTYYPGGVAQLGANQFQRLDGKQVVPVILLHGWEGSRRDLDRLASYLQSIGHAVIVPDLRGHGGSSTIRLPDGSDEPIDRDKMRRNELALMVLDVDAAKQYLLDRNNQGQLNIELLTVMGTELGALVALNWSAKDWSMRQLPTIKQGQDVKALILLSPPESFKGFHARDALRHPVIRGKLSTLIIVGAQDRDAYSDAKRLFKRFEPFHEEGEDRDLFLIEPETTLQGTRLLMARGLNIGEFIARFVDARIVRKRNDFPWTDRTSPLSSN